MFLEDIVRDTAESINSKKNNNKFLESKELHECLKVKLYLTKEKGILSNRTLFYSDNLNVNLDKNNK